MATSLNPTVRDYSLPPSYEESEHQYTPVGIANTFTTRGNATVRDCSLPPSYEESEYQYSPVGIANTFTTRRYDDPYNARKLVLLMQRAIALNESNPTHSSLP